jgi:hypothetical protein
MLFLLAVHHTLARDGGYTVALPSGIDPDDILAAVAAFNAHLQTTRTWVFGGGLQPLREGATIDASGSRLQMVDARRTSSQETLGGFWVIEVPDRDTALDWARRASAACQQPVQVRPFQRRAAA